MLNNDEKSTEPAEKFFNSDEIERHTNISREEEIKKNSGVCTIVFINCFVCVAFSHSRSASRIQFSLNRLWLVHRISSAHS